MSRSASLEQRSQASKRAALVTKRMKAARVRVGAVPSSNEAATTGRVTPIPELLARIRSHLEARK